MAKKNVILITDDPEPKGKTIKVNVRAKYNARCARWLNAKSGKKIMAVYPKDSSPTKDRVQFKAGTPLEVSQEVVSVDGGGEYRWIKGSYATHKPYTLYIAVTAIKKAG